MLVSGFTALSWVGVFSAGPVVVMVASGRRCTVCRECCRSVYESGVFVRGKGDGPYSNFLGG